MSYLRASAISSMITLGVVAGVAAKSETPIQVETITEYVEKPVLIDKHDKELTCLAQAIFAEASAEPIEGQMLVGEVILNRVKAKKYPNTICGVVKQSKQFSAFNKTDPNRSKIAETFSNLNENKIDQNAMQTAYVVAYKVTQDDYEPFLEADYWHYHANGARLNWAKDKIGLKVGNHIFYKGIA